MLFIIRILLFFILITNSILLFYKAFSNPVFLIPSLLLVAIALYIVNYTTRLSPPEIQVKYYEKELKHYYLSPYKKFRDVLVGIIALTLGSLNLYLAFSEHVFEQRLDGLLGSFLFIFMGLYQLFKVIVSNKHESPPSFIWANLRFNSLLLWNDFDKAERMLYEHANKSKMNNQQKDLFIKAGMARIIEMQNKTK